MQSVGCVENFREMTLLFCIVFTHRALYFSFLVYFEIVDSGLSDSSLVSFYIKDL